MYKENRKKQREEAVKILYLMHVNNSFTEEEINNYVDFYELKKEDLSYLYELLLEYIDNMEYIEDLINNESKNYKFNRIPIIDKCIIRASLTEIKFLNIPTSVSKNEAVEISKEYSDSDSYKIINSLLGKISRSINDWV